MTAPVQNVRVRLAERSYDIQIGAGNLTGFGRFFTDRVQASHAIVLTDENVHKLHALRVAESLGQQDLETDVIVVAPGESSKSVEVAAGLWDGLLQLGADRKTAVVAVGGGVIGDLAGFVAATFARGLRFFQAPTSLLAQVDSSVGGKVGIDLPEAKNMVGAFWQPQGVLIDAETLTTLPDNEYRAGLAEVVKYGVILDAEFFDFLEANVAAIHQRDHDTLIRMVARCCRLKADVVEQDEREETGLRAILNFGHTYGHAIEMLSWRKEKNKSHARSSDLGSLLHGEAVSIGMVLASRLAERLGRVDSHFTERLRSILQSLGLPTDVPEFDRQTILDAMKHDKKTAYGKLRFVLPSRMGHVELIGDVDSKHIAAVLDQ
ncbi:MAG: 3-dehydroquinate synthase [Thermoguttaceae bacterium]